MRILTAIALLILLIPMASAGIVDSASTAVSNGLESFFITTGDHLFNISISGYQDPADRGTVSYIYNVATFTPDPVNFAITNNFIDFSKALYAQGYPILLLAAIIITLITHYKSNVAAGIEKITGVNIGSQSNVLAKKALDGIIIATFMYIFIYIILSLNDILTKSVMLNSLDAIAPCPDNFILYFMMGIAYFIMNVFFGARILIIFLFYSFALIVGFGLLIDFTKNAAMGLCAYFVQAVFFQFFIVIYFSAAILIIKALQFPNVGELFMYLIMLFGGVVLALKLMLGTRVIRWAGNKASLLV